jgi:hypothetical protein
MIFETDADLYALSLPTEAPQARRDLLFHLLTCHLDQIKRHFKMTFEKMEILESCGYSPEKIAPYQRALLEILIELRVRGYEADYRGHLYRSASVIPVPEEYSLARERQKHRLRTLDPYLFSVVYEKTLKTLRSNAKQDSKAHLVRLNNN